MPVNVPTDIQAYMNKQALELTPSNISWKIKEWFSRGPGVYLVIGAIVLLSFLSGFIGESEKFGFAMSITFMLGVVIFITLTKTQHEPGYWRRYSAYQTWKRYPSFAASSLREIRAIRRMDEGAEFEFTVLERNGRQYGAVLFQVDGDHCTKEKVVRVFLAQGEPVQFGELYAAPAAH